ncbi:hypothetical protein CPB86DRAFT_746923 [Serendipita vermifera]|nr:hypothetical protein CPB86DRAFT_746923 [Serendipita vermifera]
MIQEGKKKRLDDAVNNAITIAKIAKDAGETIPLLAPLKASMGSVITLLEIVKDVRKCEEDWETLSNCLATRIGLLQDRITNKPVNVELQGMIAEYKETLETVVCNSEPLARKHKTWFQFVVSVKSDEDKIKDSIREMDEAFNTFTTKLQIQMQEGVSRIQVEQELIHEEVVAHRADHAKSYARILEMQDIQNNMNQTVNVLHTEQGETRSKLTETEETILLNALSAASYANGDEHEVCLKGTRVPILEQARSWLMNENGLQIFWLADVAGSGKSTVANHLAREWKRQGQLAGRFFFSRAAEQTRTTTHFFSTIAQQGLSHLGPKVRSAISDGIRDMSNPVAAPLEDQCRVLFVGPLMTLSSRLVLILDALDECEPSMLTRMLRVLLPQLANLPHLRLFLTSRPDNHIIESLQDSQVDRTSLRADIESNRKDIWKFIGEKLKSISIPQPKIVQLVTRSEGLFIWASTVCKLLLKYRGDRDQFLEQVLVQGPQQMDSLYQVALHQALPDSPVADNFDAYKRVLGVIVVVFEPLSPNTIDKLLNIRNTFKIVGDLQSVLDCRRPEDPVRFLHPTFREFLLRPFEQNPYRVDKKESHLSLAHVCLGIMGADLRWDICNLDGPPIKEGETRQGRFIACTTHALR